MESRSPCTGTAATCGTGSLCATTPNTDEPYGEVPGAETASVTPKTPEGREPMIIAATDRSGPNPTTLVTVVVLPSRLVLAQHV